MLANPENSTTMARKNPVFLATLLVLGLAVISFIAGTAYSSSVMASLDDFCDNLVNDRMSKDCAPSFLDCFKGGDNPNWSECPGYWYGGMYCLDDLVLGDGQCW